jgi:ferredoxin
MRVSIDEERCAGHGVCIGLCPEVFDLTDAGYAVTRLTEVPSELESEVRHAAQQCPTSAIIVE